ncbi:MAG TPA: aminotransferase III [Firmicutes bacterium]|jgi:acetylornithine/succinyldiaminopimelate/putrescine aminotransferase/predicted amino acid dehydrogenase|nr:aminotransferase III [Bacillota bacterium]
MHFFAENVNPHLAKQLRTLNMDKTYTKGYGCCLYDQSGTEYLDFIASYGALPFGFNPPEIWQAIQEVQESSEPSFTQPSYLGAAGELAHRLIQIAPKGLQYVTFANSGAEAVEAALKMARFRTGRLGILYTKNSFHGKTLGALSATGKELYQKGTGAPVAGFTQIPYGDANEIEKILKENSSSYAAFIVEPIQGEGGIIIPPDDYLRKALEICHQYGALLIVDEVQSGLGRTGQMFACEKSGITPDIMTIAKALGGGIIPIGACLATEDVFTEDFGNKHSSTFAGNTLACRVGLQVLDMLTRNNNQLIREVKAKGEFLLERLKVIQQKYPWVIKEVRGRGLMIGLELGVTPDNLPHSMLGIIAEQDFLSPIVSSYLLNVEKLRVAPTLNGAKVIRLEPPLIISEEQCQRAVDSIERMTVRLASGNTASFLAHLVGKKVPPFVEKEYIPQEPILPGTEDEGRFAFLVHPLYLRNYREFEESLEMFSAEEIKDLFDRVNDSLEPFVVSKARIISKTGKKAYGEFISVSRTSEELMNMPHEQVLKELTAAVNLAKKRGAKIVGLGAYTSVVTKGGRELRNLGVALTTGNSYTVAAAVDATLEAARRLGVPIEETIAAVVGATGSIGRATALFLAEKVNSLILIGNPNNEEHGRRRLQKLIAEIYQFLSREELHSGGAIYDFVRNHPLCPAPDAEIEQFQEFATLVAKESPIIYTVDLGNYLPSADIVVTATSQVNSLITPDMLKFGAVVCDVARPADVSTEVKEARPDVLVIDGGVIAVPGAPDLGWNFGFEKGLAYACMSETMMLALEERYEHHSLGVDINTESIGLFKELAKKHGFQLAGFRSFDKPLPEEAWNKVVQARAKGQKQKVENAS